MIDRFTQKAREAIRLAVETAQELEHGYVGTEHLLLGLIKEGTGVAAAVLAEHDVIARYLGRIGACSGAVEAFEVLWREYAGAAD